MRLVVRCRLHTLSAGFGVRLRNLPQFVMIKDVKLHISFGAG